MIDRRLAVGWLLAISAVFAGGALGSASAAWLAWRGVTPLPTGSQVAALVSSVGLDSSKLATNRRDDVFGYQPPLANVPDKVLVPVLGTDGYGPGSVTATVGAVRDPANFLITMRTALVSDGWRVSEVSTDAGSRSFGATKGGLLVTWHVDNREDTIGRELSTFEPAIKLTVQRDEPDRTRWFVIAGWFAGGGLGLALIALGVRRWASSQSDSVPMIIMLIGFALMLPANGLTTLENLPYLFQPHPHPFSIEANWDWYMFIGTRPLAILGALLILAAPAYRVRKRLRPNRSTSVNSASPRSEPAWPDLT